MKSIVLKLLQASGLYIRTYNISNSEWLRMLRTLESHRVTTTLDVGANTGQFARRLRLAGFRGRIVSFEPLSTAHFQLARQASRDPQWLAAPRVLLSDHEGMAMINVSQNSVSSSVLPIMQSHLRAAPESQYVGGEKVRCARLDQVAAEYVSKNEVIFLKLDVQGYELEVLHGAEDLLPRVACLRLELSLVPLYEGQTLYAEMIKWIENKGFVLWGLEPGFVDLTQGRMLQVDGLFCREGS